MTKEPASGNGPAMPRRMFLAAAPAALVTSNAGHAGQGDPHRAWLEEWQENRDIVNDHSIGEGPLVDALDARRFRLEDLIAETPPRTMEGFKAQLEWLVLDADDAWNCA